MIHTKRIIREYTTNNNRKGVIYEAEEELEWRRGIVLDLVCEAADDFSAVAEAVAPHYLGAGLALAMQGCWLPDVELLDESQSQQLVLDWWGGLPSDHRQRQLRVVTLQLPAPLQAWWHKGQADGPAAWGALAQEVVSVARWGGVYREACPALWWLHERWPRLNRAGDHPEGWYYAWVVDLREPRGLRR